MKRYLGLVLVLVVLVSIILGCSSNEILPPVKNSNLTTSIPGTTPPPTATIVAPTTINTKTDSVILVELASLAISAVGQDKPVDWRNWLGGSLGLMDWMNKQSGQNWANTQIAIKSGYLHDYDGKAEFSVPSIQKPNATISATFFIKYTGSTVTTTYTIKFFFQIENDAWKIYDYKLVYSDNIYLQP